MHKDNREAIQLTEEIKRSLFDVSEVDVGICPPFTALSDVKDVLVDTNIKLGAQNVYYEDEGAFTGEISVKMLSYIGCDLVIVGHSERRKYFAETDAVINRKLKKVLEYKMTPIFCIGETLEEREAGLTFGVLERQINEGLKDFSPQDLEKIVIAYEPVWAIGTGRTATPQQAQEAHSFIRNLLNKKFGDSSRIVRILYGGSIKPQNIRELILQEDVDGGLVGGASLKAQSFVEIVRNSISK